jgi:hypothetical protein
MIANEKMLLTNQAGIFMKTEEGYRLVQQTGEQKKAYLDQLKDLVTFLETRCKVVPCLALAAVEPERREVLINFFGQYGAESIILASAPGSVLWTDDHVQANLARNEYGVRRVWTQLVIGYKVDSGLLDANKYFDASARLVGFRYFFTSVNIGILKQAAVLADWKTEGWPLKQALEVFEDASIDLWVAMQLAAGFLKVVYAEGLLAGTQNVMMVRILEHIAKRDGGIPAIKALRNVLHKIFGLNIIGMVAAMETIDAWLKGK